MDFSRILLFGDMSKLRDMLRTLKEAGKQFDFAMNTAQLGSLLPSFQPQLILVSDSASSAEKYEIKALMDRYPGAVLKQAKDFHIR